MKLRFLLMLLTLSIGSALAKPDFNAKHKNDSLKIYLDIALDLMKKRSVNTAKLNWEQIYANAYLDAAEAKTIREIYPAIRNALKQLGDSHSKFFPPEMVKGYLMGYRATGQKFPEIEVAFLKDKYAFISLPPFYSFNFAEWNEFADTFRERVKQLQQKHPKGWIIDLRNNEGGMFAPMYAALAPFIDQRKVLGWKDGVGKNHFMAYNKEKLYEDNTVTHEFKLIYPMVKITRLPIIILINRKTASSGEFAAIAFAGQKNVTFVGTPTNGLTSANQEHKLSDGAFLVLTEGNLIDRNYKEYSKMGEGLQPDLKIENLTGNSKIDNQLYLENVFEFLDKK